MGGGYYNAIQKLDPEINRGQQKLFNMVHDAKDHANGPAYITGIELAGVGITDRWVPGGILINRLGALHGIFASGQDNPDALPKLAVEHATHESMARDATRIPKLSKLSPSTALPSMLKF